MSDILIIYWLCQQVDILVNLFNTYCCSLYRSVSTFKWIQKLHHGLEYSCEKSIEFTFYNAHLYASPLSGSLHIKYKLYIRDIQFLYHLDIDVMTMPWFANTCTTVLLRRMLILFFCYKITFLGDNYGIIMSHDSHSDCINSLKKSAKLSDEKQRIIDNIWSLFLVKSNQ